MTHFSFASLTERELTAVNGGYQSSLSGSSSWVSYESDIIPFEPFPTILPIPDWYSNPNIQY